MTPATLRGGITVRATADFDADTSYLDQEDWGDRLDAYKAGQFGFVGIDATAEVVANGVIQRITSGGLWGIEDDSGREYFDSVAVDQVAELVGVLAELGVVVAEPAEWEWAE